MKRILIPTDFSEQSRKSISHMIETMRDTNVTTKILLLNTYIVQQTDPALVIRLNDEMKHKSRSGLDKLRNELIDNIKNPKIEVLTASQMGSLKNVIMQFLQKEQIAHIAVTKNQLLELSSLKDFIRSRSCSFIIHE